MRKRKPKPSILDWHRYPSPAAALDSLQRQSKKLDDWMEMDELDKLSPRAARSFAKKLRAFAKRLDALAKRLEEKHAIRL